MKKEYKEQIEQLEREIAEATEPDADKYMELFAMYHIVKKDDSKCREVLRKALDIQTQVFAKPNIDYVEEGLKLAHIYDSMEQKGMAKLTCEKLVTYLKEQPENAEILTKFGEVYQRGLDDNATAKTYFEKALGEDSRKTEALIGLFHVYTDHFNGSANKEKAIETLNLLKKVDPENYFIEIADSTMEDFDEENSLFSEINETFSQDDYTRVIIDTTTQNNLTESDIELLRKRDWASYVILGIAIVAFIVVCLIP